ncbi:UNVERIFIED_CONTAM: hypothetical protein Sradi_6445300 [Sesamum radiatum]|uniref:Uncharacterized protein n=1 Tax=Sesamum radiatum TaxID=300843 RepID=A0AAW2K413_SESRA
MENSEAKYPGHTQSVSQGPEIFLSSEFEVPSSINPDYGESKQEVAPRIHQHPVVHSSSNYNIGFMQPILSGQLPPFESSESQTHDVPQLPSFAVQQSFDPTSYYAQFYRSGMDGDGRTLPLQSAGAANKYNGNAALVSAQTSQSPQEVQVGAPLIQSMVSSAPLVTQAAGIMQSSIAATQQPLPVFHQPTGVHLPHYPPFIAYGPYFSPFYVPPPAIHHFLSNGASSQQPRGGSLYPTPPGTIAKYSVSQYKQGSSSGSSSHVRVAGSYGSYGLSAPNYTPSSATPVLTSTLNEDIAALKQRKITFLKKAFTRRPCDHNFDLTLVPFDLDISSEGSGVSQGQLAFTSTQPGHGAFTGIFHPAQAVTAATVHPLLLHSQVISNHVDMGGQQPVLTSRSKKGDASFGNAATSSDFNHTS